MTNAYLDLRKKNSEPTARKVWWYLPKMDPLKMVITDEPTDDALTYLKKGELEDINFKAFEKRYSRLLAKLRKQNLPPLID